MNLFHIEDSWNQHPLISRSIQRETQTKKSTQFVGTFFGLQVDDFLVPVALTPVVPECGILRLNSPENRFSSKNTKPRGCRSLVWEGLITSWGHCWPAVINNPNNQTSTLNSPAGLFHKFDPKTWPLWVPEPGTPAHLDSHVERVWPWLECAGIRMESALRPG